MKLKLFFIALIFVVYTNTSAQISLGINLEPFILSGDIGSDGISPLGVSAAVGYQFDSTKSFSLRAGLYSRNFDARQFAGRNYSLFGKYQFNSSLYILAGLSFYNNNATSSMSGKITNHSIFLFGCGLGAKLFSWLHIENILFLPIGNSEFASILYSGTYAYNYRVGSLFQINLGVEFEL